MRFPGSLNQFTPVKSSSKDIYGSDGSDRVSESLPSVFELAQASQGSEHTADCLKWFRRRDPGKYGFGQMPALFGIRNQPKDSAPPDMSPAIRRVTHCRQGKPF
jgi:hypothetical protein